MFAYQLLVCNFFLSSFQISLLEQRSRSLLWELRSSMEVEEVDNAINFHVGNVYRAASHSELVGNPILNQEYLEAHDAVLLCGPLKLNDFVDSSGRVVMLNFSSHLLLQSTARNFLLHMKYVPSISQVSMC